MTLAVWGGILGAALYLTWPRNDPYGPPTADRWWRL